MLWSRLTWTEHSLHRLYEVLGHQVDVVPHLSHSFLLIARYRPQDLVVLLLLKHVAHSDRIHHHVVVRTKVLQQAVVITWVKATVCDHHHGHFGSSPLAVLDEGVVGKLEGRWGEGASGDPLKILHSHFKGRHGVDVGIIQTNGLEGPVVTELHNTDSGAWKCQPCHTVRFQVKINL